MNRILEMRFAAEARDKKKAELEQAKQDEAAARLHLKSWHLDPMRSRLNADTETR
jgi:hypothetical protein